jgi:hypothetical protein
VEDERCVMRILRKILLGLLILALLYGALRFVEHLTEQELTRVSDEATQESASLMWSPRLLKGDGICSLDLLDAEGHVLDTARLGILNAGFDALQQFGQLGFHDQEITVADRRTGELARRFVVRDGRLSPQD